MSVRGALRNPRRIHGKDLVHDFVSVTAHLGAFLREQWNRSMSLFACGWYAMVVKTVMSNPESVTDHALEVNCALLSVVTILGMPKRATQQLGNAWSTVSAIASAMAAASGQQVVLSIIVSTYRLFCSRGNGPTTSS